MTILWGAATAIDDKAKMAVVMEVRVIILDEVVKKQYRFL